MSNNETKVYLVLNETKSKKCTSTQIEEIRQLFNTNPSVKNLFKNQINNVLKEVFSKNYYDKGKYSDGEMSGVYDLEQEGRSVINKLNTNYSCFSVLLRDVNQVLTSTKVPIINFSNKSSDNQITEVKKFINVIEQYKTRIFDPTSTTFQSLMMVLGQTHAWGQKREDTTIEILKKQFGVTNVKSVGKLGSSEDMIGGIDCEIIINNKTITAQIKPFTHIISHNNHSMVLGSGNVKKYHTDWIIFAKNNKDVLIFDNNLSKIIDGNFVFPEENLIYTLS